MVFEVLSEGEFCIPVRRRRLKHGTCTRFATEGMNKDILGRLCPSEL